MCRRVTCSQCNKPTFAGCGAHVEQVLASVPHDQRCKCRDQPAKPRAAGPSASGGAGQAAGGGAGPWWEFWKARDK